VKEILTMYGIA